MVDQSAAALPDLHQETITAACNKDRPGGDIQPSNASSAMPVHNAEVAAMFDQTAELLEIEGENSFHTGGRRG